MGREGRKGKRLKIFLLGAVFIIWVTESIRLKPQHHVIYPLKNMHMYPLKYFLKKKKK